MRVLVLGSGAGGGVPQWNCAAENSELARNVSELARNRVQPRTQSSLAVSPDGKRWVLLNASPDLRQQINANPVLWPQTGGAPRNSPIAAVVLTNADVDHVAGLLTLRERQPFAIHGTARVLGVLASNSIFDVLDRELVRRLPLTIGMPIEVLPPSASSPPLTVTPFLVPGKIALYLEQPDAGAGLGTEDGDTIGLEVSDGQSRLHYVPGCARVDESVRARLEASPLVLLDGTLYKDDEMIALGLSQKTGRRMGHVSMSGPDGTLAALARTRIGRRVFIHINTSNPVLREDSPERAEVERQGWQIAYDGLEFTL